MLKKHIKKLLFGCLLIIVLIYVAYPNSIGNIKSDVSTTKTTTESVDKSNSETKEKILTGLLNDLHVIDSSYNKTEANAFPNAKRGEYMNNIGEKYISLIEKTYNSISELENHKEKISTEKQTSLTNVKKACDDAELSSKSAGGGSGGSTNIPYAKMNAARKEVCNALKTYLECSDDNLVWKEMNEDNKTDSSLDKVKNDYINLNRKTLNNETLAIPDTKIAETTPDNSNEKAYIVTSSMIIPDHGLGTPKYRPIKVKLQYDKNGKYTFKYLETK